MPRSRTAAPLLLLAAQLLIPGARAFTKLPFVSCTDKVKDPLAPSQLTVTTVFGQLTADNHLALNVLATTPQPFVGFSNETERLATLFTTTSVLTFDIYSQPSCFCSTIRPQSPLPESTTDTPCESNGQTYCPLPAGPFAFSVRVPLDDDYSLMTIQTRLRILDVSVPALQLACVDVAATPLHPHGSTPYASANLALWLTLTLFLAYLVLLAAARIASAWGRATIRTGSSTWSHIQRTGFICVSALSGERFRGAPALLRFCTPAARDILFHTQWCAALGMVAVQWPDFAYPLLSRTAWSMLLFNATYSSGATHWDPLSSRFVVPTAFADQVADRQSPLFLDPEADHSLLSFPDDATAGLTTFVAAVGLEPKDAFGTTVASFLSVLAAAVAVSALVWFLDLAGGAVFNRSAESGGKYHATAAGYTTSLGLGHKDVATYNDTITDPAEDAGNGTTTTAGPARRGLPRAAFLSRWWRRTRWANSSSFHGSVLVGNLTRILLLFHLPVTIFSCFQFSQEDASTTAKVLAALAFAFVSVFWPLVLAWRIAITPTNKLFDETRTLMQLGATYNMYRQDSQLFAMVVFVCNLALGITIGCGQDSGTAQSIVILVIEVAAALVTSLWLPWGHGARMGVVSFLCCASRIISAVLLVILAPIVSVGSAAGGWVAYAILVIQLGVYALFAFMLLVKLVEALARLLYRVTFEATSPSSGRYPGHGGGLLTVLRIGHALRRSDFKGTRVPSPVASTGRAGKNPRAFSATTVGSDEGGSVALPLHTRMDSATPLRPNQGSGSVSSAAFSSPVRGRYDDGDEDDGSIMGAWKHFPFNDGAGPDVSIASASTTAVGVSRATTGPGPIPGVASTQPAAPARSSGFARVGGGRANADNPYAVSKGAPPSAFIRRAAGPAAPTVGAPVATDSHATPAGAAVAESGGAPFPSTASFSLSSAFGRPSVDEEDDDHEDDEHGVAAASGSSSTRPLPPGAMPPPHHVRTRSQTAVIEDASLFLRGGGRRTSQERSSPDDPTGRTTPLHMNVPAIRVSDFEDGVPDSEATVAAPKRKWFGGRSSSNTTNASAASGNASASGSSAQTVPDPLSAGLDDEAAPTDETKPKPGWFRRTRKSDGDLQSAAAADQAVSGPSEGRSFVVKRKDKPTPPAGETSFKVIRQARAQHPSQQTSDPGSASSADRS